MYSRKVLNLYIRKRPFNVTRSSPPPTTHQYTISIYCIYCSPNDKIHIIYLFANCWFKIYYNTQPHQQVYIVFFSSSCLQTKFVFIYSDNIYETREWYTSTAYRTYYIEREAPTYKLIKCNRYRGIFSIKRYIK